MGGVVRAIVSPLSIIDRDLGRLSLQIVAIGAAFIPGGQPIAAAAALALAVLYKPKGPKPEQQERSIKTPMPPRVSGYGLIRLFGAYILYVTNEDGYAVDVWAFHDGRLDFIERIYLGDKQVKLNGGGFVIAQNDGEFGDGDTIQIGTRLGLDTETAFAEVIARLPGIWTSNHRGDGVATGCMISKPVKAKNYNAVYPTGGPDANAMSIVARAQRVFDWRDPTQDINDPLTWKWSDNAALAIAHYYLVRNNKDWDTHFAPTLSYWTAFADDCDVPMEVYHGAGVFVDDADSGDTSFELTSVEGLAPGKTVTLAAYGIDKVVHSVSGNIVTLTSSLGDDYKAGTVLRWIGGGTEPRYRVALAHKHTDAHKVTLGNLLAACDGMVTTRADGALVPWSGRYVEPDPDDLIGPGEIVTWSMDDGIVDEDQANVVALTYLSADHDFTTVPTSDWRDEDSIAKVGEKPTTLDNAVPSHAQAARLAKRLLAKTMAENRGTLRLNSKGRKLRSKRFFPLHIEEAGTVFLSGPAEVVKFKRTQTGADVDYVMVDTNIDAWNAATEEGQPAPVGARPAVVPLETPVVTDAEAQLSADGSSASIRITVDGFSRDDVTWHARTREAGDVSWNEQEYTDIDPGPSAVLLTSLVPTDASIEVAVYYGLGDGRRSEWSATETVSTSTAALAPTSPTMLTLVSTTVDSATIAARAPTSTNFAYLRFYANTVNDFSTATAISSNLVDAPGAVIQITETSIVAGQRYWWAVAYNATGVASTPTTPISAFIGGFSFMGGALPSGATLTRADPGTYRDNSGALATAAANVARFTYSTSTLALLGLLYEAASVNSLPNNTMVGAANGVIGSGGALPTGWAQATAGGMTREIIGSGTINGMNYIDVRFSGSATTTGAITLTTEPVATVTTGTTWTQSVYVALVAGSLANVTGFQLRSGNESGASSFTPNATLTRISNTRTLTSTQANQTLRWNFVATATAVDFTLRIALPQRESGSKATSPIKTSGSAVMRGADALALNWTARHVPDGSITVRVTFDDASTQDVAMTVSSGSGTLATSLNRSIIQKVEKL